jgi:hypothetical protein
MTVGRDALEEHRRCHLAEFYREFGFLSRRLPLA